MTVRKEKFYNLMKLILSASPKHRVVVTLLMMTNALEIANHSVKRTMIPIGLVTNVTKMISIQSIKLDTKIAKSLNQYQLKSMRILVKSF